MIRFLPVLFRSGPSWAPPAVLGTCKILFHVLFFCELHWVQACPPRGRKCPLQAVDIHLYEGHPYASRIGPCRRIFHEEVSLRELNSCIWLLKTYIPVLKSSTKCANSFFSWFFESVSGLILRSSTSQAWNSVLLLKILMIVSLDTAPDKNMNSLYLR